MSCVRTFYWHTHWHSWVAVKLLLMGSEWKLLLASLRAQYALTSSKRKITMWLFKKE
jgi:hypothetical protein